MVFHKKQVKCHWPQPHCKVSPLLHHASAQALFELCLRHCHYETTTLLFGDYGRLLRSLRKLTRRCPLGLRPPRRRRGAHLTTSLVQSATVYCRTLPLCRCDFPRLYVHTFLAMYPLPASCRSETMAFLIG